MSGQKDEVQQSLVEARPGIDKVNFGVFRRVEPISRAFGFDRGNPVDRFYIERYLAALCLLHGLAAEEITT